MLYQGKEVEILSRKSVFDKHADMEAYEFRKAMKTVFQIRSPNNLST